MIKGKFYLIALLITLICVIYVFINFKLVQKEYIAWNKNAILVAKDSNNKVEFIFPKYHKMFIINNVETIVKPYKIHSFYYNIIIDDSRLIISFLTDDAFYNNIVISYNIKDLRIKYTI